MSKKIHIRARKLSKRTALYDSYCGLTTSSSVRVVSIAEANRVYTQDRAETNQVRGQNRQRLCGSCLSLCPKVPRPKVTQPMKKKPAKLTHISSPHKKNTKLMCGRGLFVQTKKISLLTAKKRSVSELWDVCAGCLKRAKLGHYAPEFTGNKPAAREPKTHILKVRRDKEAWCGRDATHLKAVLYSDVPRKAGKLQGPQGDYCLTCLWASELVDTPKWGEPDPDQGRLFDEPIDPELVNIDLTLQEVLAQNPPVKDSEFVPSSPEPKEDPYNHRNRPRRDKAGWQHLGHKKWGANKKVKPEIEALEREGFPRSDIMFRRSFREDQHGGCAGMLVEHTASGLLAQSLDHTTGAENLAMALHRLLAGLLCRRKPQETEAASGWIEFNPEGHALGTHCKRVLDYLDKQGIERSDLRYRPMSSRRDPLAMAACYLPTENSAVQSGRLTREKNLNQALLDLCNLVLKSRGGPKKPGPKDYQLKTQGYNLEEGEGVHTCPMCSRDDKEPEDKTCRHEGCVNLGMLVEAEDEILRLQEELQGEMDCHLDTQHTLEAEEESLQWTRARAGELREERDRLKAEKTRDLNLTMLSTDTLKARIKELCGDQGIPVDYLPAVLSQTMGRLNATINAGINNYEAEVTKLCEKLATYSTPIIDLAGLRNERERIEGFLVRLNVLLHVCNEHDEKGTELVPHKKNKET